MLSWLGRFVLWCLHPLLVRLDRVIDPGRVLDGLLRLVDGRATPALARIPAAPDAMPRRSFASGQRFSEQFFIRLRRPQLLRIGEVNPKLIRNMFRAARFYRAVFPATRDEAPDSLFAEIEGLARGLGASDIGYIREIRDHEIFAGKAIPHRGAIVFTVEMDREGMSTAPSFDAFNEVSKGYLRLSVVANAISEFLRARGFAAYPGTALGGTTDYVAVAERAGLGVSGYHGLLITPTAGARVRISTIYTNITNLPVLPAEHAWVRDFCAQCRKCVRSCPPGAIYERPRPRSGGMACIEYKACLDYFAANFGCAVCLAVCPFSNAGYAQVKAGFVGTKARPERLTEASGPARRIAVVGAGPAGFFVTKALLELDVRVEVDLFERLPTPHGLVRFGLAPDHLEVKAKAWAFDRILEDPRVRLFANVAFGGDVTREDIRARYDGVVYATGASASRTLGIDGEALAGCFGASEFVAWYNGHPDHAGLAPTFERPHVAIVGAGNVALDVARMLLTNPDGLMRTDMTASAVAALSRSQVTDVHILVRRGPADVSFTPRELRDLAELPGVRVIVDPTELTRPRPERIDERVRRNLELLERFAAAPAGPDGARQVHFHFYTSPTTIVGVDGRVDAVRLARTPAAGAEVRELSVGLVIRAVGYRSAPLASVPFDGRRCIIPNVGGRVTDQDGQILPGEYVSGWVRRGPLGILGTNKVDAEEVARAVLDDLAGREPVAGPAIELALAERQVRWIGKDDWWRLAHEERRRGSKHNRAAEKFTSLDDVLHFMNGARGPSA